jgi:hypothetical protein
MKGKRSGLDFSKHILEAHESTMGDEKIWQHYLRIPGQSSLGIKFTNVSGSLLVTGDFGNYVFSRRFVPSAESEKVSEHYWLEKITMRNVSPLRGTSGIVFHGQDATCQTLWTQRILL